MTKKDKANLIAAIQSLLQNQTVSTQEDIRDALQQKGFEVNQAQISRVLHKLGAIKVNEVDGVFYRLPPELAVVSPKDPLKQLILSIAHNESLVVIQTKPGAANLVARLLDQNKPKDLLGTMAGDDTIFVAPEKLKYISRLYKTIIAMLLE